MGILYKILVGDAFQDENNKRCCKRDLGLIRNVSCGKNDDDRNKIKEILIYQSCNQGFVVYCVQYATVNLPETVQNLYESTVAVKGNSLFHEGAL